MTESTKTATTTTATAGGVSHSRHVNAKLVLHFWACVLFCRRWLRPVVPPAAAASVDRHAAAVLVRGLRAEHAREARRIVRFAWPTFVAAIEVTSPVDRAWLLARLHEARGASAECERSADVAARVVAAQEAAEGGCVDLGLFMPAPP